MTFTHAFILGLVEGITEFLPVSSTAHLIITSSLLGLKQTPFVSFFEVFIQAGAICAVVAIYFRYLMQNKALWSKVLAAFVPTAIIGFMLHDFIKSFLFQQENIISYALIGVGVIFLVVELLAHKKIITFTKELSQLTYKHAILVGLVQSLAIVPGVSRAGAVIIIMLLLGFKRTEAALFSFILAIPTIFAASALDIVKLDSSLLTIANINLIIIGFLTAMFSAFVVVKWLIGYLQRNTLTSFAVYRIVVGAVLILGLI